METRKHTILVISALSCVGLLSAGVAAMVAPGQAEDDAFAVAALEDLKGVRVKVVQVFSIPQISRTRPDYIDSAKLQARAELALREAGIRVFEDSSPDPEIGELVITINTWPTPVMFRCILEVRTEVYQLADLVKGNRLRLLAPTWPAGRRLAEAKTVTDVKRSQAERAAEKEMYHQLQMFVTDYRTANPQMFPAMTGTVKASLCVRGPHATAVHRYEILGDNGRHYSPTNLPHEFKIDGLRVWFRFRPIERYKWGAAIEIIEIDTL